MNTKEFITKIENGEFDALFTSLYGTAEGMLSYQRARYIDSLNEFCRIFGESEVKIFSASGRTEIGGNHTDHQHGKVLGGAVNLDVIGVVRFHTEGICRVHSKGFTPDEIVLDTLEVKEGEKGTGALLRGIAKRFSEKGVTVGGFDTYTTSDVASGGGVSSSAAFETLLGTIIDIEYNGGKSTPFEIAEAGWFAENFYFGKKCGLLDQSVTATGGLVAIDFKNPKDPKIEKVDYDFAKEGYCICLTDTKSSHENLTDDYVAITEEMKAVATFFGKEFLEDVSEKEFYENIPAIREKASDRAVLRAMHYFSETKRAEEEVNALKENDLNRFLSLVNESGASSESLLQNLYSLKTPTAQAIPLALAISKKILNGEGATRVHGGGFAGTIQAFVPLTKIDTYVAEMEKIFGQGACHKLSIRPVGGVEVKL